MKRRSKMILGSTAAIAVAAGFFAVRSAQGDDDGEGPAVVAVTRGEVVAKALAVGTIEPETDASVKSKVGGVVARLFVDEGTRVEAGAPLLEIRPNPAPVELVEARRQVELRAMELANARREMERQRALTDRQLAAAQELDRAAQTHREMELQLRMAREKLQLLESGRSAGVESVVRAPITGFVLQKMVNEGDPVTAASTYQEGTELMLMADMDRLLFRGTVDEIDVGKLREGMPVEIKIGALPDARVQGTVRRISLKAQKEENATTFPVEIELTQTAGDATLRAGLSANAEIIIQRRERVLTVPERVVTFAGDTAWVNVRAADGTAQKRVIRTGLSDAVQVEVLGGLREGESVLEKPAKTIE